MKGGGKRRIGADIVEVPGNGKNLDFGNWARYNKEEKTDLREVISGLKIWTRKLFKMYTEAVGGEVIDHALWLDVLECDTR